MNPYSVHTVKDGDTIQSVAKLYSVDWTELATINGLSWPFIVANVSNTEYLTNDQVAKIGDTIVIPTNDLIIPRKTNNSSEEVEKYAFGCDLDIFSVEETEHQVLNLEAEGQLIDDGNGDIKLAEGILNLKQQLITRLGTPKGALLLHPEFGSNITEYIGRKTTIELLTQVKLEVQEAILGDFRVEAISNLTVEFRNGCIWVDVLIHPIKPYSIFRFTHTFE